MVQIAFPLVAVLSVVSVSAFSSPHYGSHHAAMSRSNLLQQRTHSVKLSVSAPSSMADSFEFNDEIPELQPGQPQQTAASSQRKRTSLEEAAAQRRTKYAVGDELHRLRHNVMALSLELQEARRSGSPDDVADLEQSILRAQQYDAEFVYTVSLERMEVAERSGRFQEANRLRAVAMDARSALPQFNLSGLWVGKYGDQGYELINVTYSGDVLVAHKITGTKNVPKGEATFEVNLSPAAMYASGEPPLEPIELGESAANQWGSKYLQRFAGRGQVAAEGYLDSQWVDGQLILVNEYFSFAWLPIGHQVFFGRPTAELILKLMKDDNNSNVADSSARSHLERCWEETENVLDDMEVTDGPIVYSSNQQDYYRQEGCFD